MTKHWQDRLKHEPKEDTTGFNQDTIKGLTNEEKEAIERINKPRYDKITGEEVEPINSYLTTDLEETDSNKFQITDQYGELLLECEVGDKYHRLIIQEGLNKILKEAVEHWEKDDADYYTGPEPNDIKKAPPGSVFVPDENESYLVKVEEAENGDAVVNLPDELLDEMGWKEGDIIDIEETLNCFDDFEVPSLILRNLTKEKNDEN